MKNKLNYNIDWGQYFELNSESPSGIQRNKDINGRPFRKVRFGNKHYQVSGKPHAWLVGFKSRTYLVHRIIWVMIHGSIDPDLIIDHIDGNPFNNSIDNLSLKTQADNTRNKQKRIDNKTKVTGVCLMNTGKGSDYYHVRCTDADGKRKSKYFSINKLGDSKAKELAIEYRQNEIKRLISEGLIYTDRHNS